MNSWKNNHIKNLFDCCGNCGGTSLTVKRLKYFRYYEEPVIVRIQRCKDCKYTCEYPVHIHAYRFISQSY